MKSSASAITTILIATFTLAPVLSSVSPALAHYEGAGDYAAHKQSKSKTKDANQNESQVPFDPWELLEKALTQPAFALSDYVRIYINGDYRYIQSNGIPDHKTGEFPNAGNPNTISEQHYSFRVPVKGTIADRPTVLGMSPFGVAINGVPFDPGAMEFWNRDPGSGWQYEAMYLGPRLGLDANNAHVQPNGAYHYHGPPTGLIDKLEKAGKPVLIGYAADGFPIYGPFGYKQVDNPSSGMTKLRSSYRIKNGTRPNGPGGTYNGAFIQDYEFVKDLGDLDNCNGRFGVTPEYPQGTYYYVISDTYPYIPRLYKGTPDSTFRRRPPPPGFMPGGPGFGPPGGPGFGPPGFGPPPQFGEPPN
jgi:hypothetical protein